MMQLVDIRSNMVKDQLTLADHEYFYAYYPKSQRDQLTFDGFASFSIFLLPETQSSVWLSQINQVLEPGGCVQVENDSLSINLRGMQVELLFAGTRQSAVSETSIVVQSPSQIYKVSKPWGHELWLNGEHPNYAFKQIYIREGFRTSLQYHSQKHETNFLFHGSANLHYESEKNEQADYIAEGRSIRLQLLTSPISIDVPPPTIHRLEAVTDSILYEVSTPFLDDVIRIQDDMGRLDGRIQSEHNR